MAMAAPKPALHIFPPVEEAQKRRDSLDELIRKSMDMRPTGPWPTRNESHVAKPRTRGGYSKSSSPAEAIAIRIDSPALEMVQVTATVTQPRPIMKAPRPNPYPLHVAGSLHRSSSASPSNTYPRRRPSNAASQRSISPMHVTGGKPVGFSGTAVSSQQSSPISPADSLASTQKTADQSKASTPISSPDREAASSRSSNRKQPTVAESPIEDGVTTPIASLQRKGSSRASNRTPQRQVSSRASNRTRVVFPTASTPDRRRVVSPAPSEQTSARSDSPTLVRNNSVATWKGQSARSEKDQLRLRSMFPTYDHNVPLARQVYRPPPSHIAPIKLPSEKVSKPEYSPTMKQEIPPPEEKEPVYVTPSSDLNKLWDCTNGQIGVPQPKKFTMKMCRATSGAKKQKISFGPDESQPFFSLSQSHANTSEADPHHELLIFRHCPEKDDILPICHSMLQPPPPPTLSKANRSSLLSDPNEPSVQITTITPIVATLHSLDNAAKTPQAHTLALVDPQATSPAAARLAERAVADAIARESCTLSWTRTCPKSGKYELHHPSLGVFTVHTEGNIAASFEKEGARGPTSIYITNPFSNMASGSNSPLFGNGDITKPKPERKEDVLARLDLQEGYLHIDAAGIQQLGNLYLIDVCVSALLAVAVAETQRPGDPGLLFAAPPPSPFDGNFKKTNKKEKPAPKAPKPPKKKLKKTDPSSRISLGGIEHLADEEDLPRITRGILSILGFSLKTAIFILGMGVKLTASMVVSLSKIASKDGA